jgi:hypothetical protein
MHLLLKTYGKKKLRGAEAPLRAYDGLTEGLCEVDVDEVNEFAE